MTHTPTLFRRALGISLGTLASRVLGFARDVLMAWLLGGSLAADALVIALRLPQVMRRLFAEGALSLSLTADLHLAGDHACTPNAIVRAVQWRLGIVLALAVLAGEMLAVPLTRCLAPGLASDSPRIALAAEYLRICLPYTLTAGMAALGMARLHHAGRFFVPTLMPLVLNIVVLLFGAVALFRQWQGLGSPHSAALLLAVGLLCGGIAQWLLQLYAVRRLPAVNAVGAAGAESGIPATAGGAATSGGSSTPVTPDVPVASGTSSFSDVSGTAVIAGSPVTSGSTISPPPALVRRILIHLPLGILGAAAPQLAMLGAMMVASALAQGSMTALYFAERLMELPLGLLGAALGMASLPTLARMAYAGRLQELSHTTEETLCLSLCLTLPAMTGLMGISTPLVHSFFPTFDAYTSRAAVLALWGYAPGIPAYGLTRPLLSASHALGLRMLASGSGIAALGVALPAALLGMWLLPQPWQMLGPAASVSLGLWAQSLILLVGVRRHFHDRGEGFSPMRPVLVSVCAGAVLTGLTAFGTTLLTLSTWGALVAAVGAGIAVYGLTLKVGGGMAFLRGILRRKGA